MGCSCARMPEKLSSKLSPIKKRRWQLNTGFCTVKCYNMTSEGIFSKNPAGLPSKQRVASQRVKRGTYGLPWYEAPSSPSRADGIDMEVTHKQGGQRASQAVQCVGGTERERERGRNTVSIKAVSWRKRVQAASPVGLQHGSRTELACIRECICVWKSGGWDANEVNVTARMSAGSPGCLLHSLCFSVGWLDTKSSLIGEEVLAVHTPSGSQKFWGKKKKSNRINNLPSRSGLSSSKVSLWFGLESSVPFWS